MADHRRFVQFPHPGGEHSAESGRVWNPNRPDSPHRRKFMLLDGQWVDDNDEPQAGELHAWGEWEPEAKLVTELERDGRPGLPRHLWRPYYIPKGSYRGLHNTDPFIFGPRFLYSNCRQPRHADLRRLARGSVIAFGSGKTIDGERRWLLDTVFVVKDFVDYDPAGAREQLEGWAPAEFLDVTAGPLADGMGGTCGGCTPATGPRFRLYRGATPADPVDGMYSFFPALPAGVDIGFPRPPINLPGRYFNPRSWQAPKGLGHERGADELRGLWSSLVHQVRESGLVLGTGARAPACMDPDTAAVRLKIAHQIVSQLWQSAPRHQPAAPPDYDYARSWPWIPAGYQLVEQAFKLLLSIHWCVPPAEVRRRFGRGSAHDLNALFAELPPDDKEAVESAYQSFVDLHDYIPVKTAGDFLASVGQGYGNWRYVLLEGWKDSRGEPDPRRAPPTSHIGALIEIAAVAIARAAFHLNGKPKALPFVAERIAYELDVAVGDRISRLQEEGAEREDRERCRKRLHQLLVEHRHAIAAHLDNTDNPKLGPQPPSDFRAEGQLPPLPEELAPIVAELKSSRDRKNYFAYFCRLSTAHS